jgi:autotransporter-associated beta strand protein
LSGVNTYTGGTLVNGTTLVVSNNSSVGTGAVTLNNAIFQADGLSNLTFANNFRLTGANLIDANGTTLTIAGGIAGAGSVEFANGGGGLVQRPGTVVLLGASSYTGGTLICACTALLLGDGTHTASIVGAIDNEGTVGVVNANLSGVTSILNDGLITFFSGTSASKAQLTNFGEIDFVADATAPNAAIVSRSGGFTIFNIFASAGNASITNRGGSYTAFYDGSTAGNAAITNLGGGQLFFHDDSTAANATITNGSHGSLGIPVGVLFSDNSTAGNATIINNNGGAIAFGFPGGTDTASAGNANITNNSGSTLQFNAFTTTGNAIITAQSGGAIAFFDNSTGGNAQFITNGTGYVDFGRSVGPNSDGVITAGSIAGSGLYYIGGGNTLVVGSNNLSTTVSGVIADNNPCACTTGPGSLEKVGNGTLTLSGVNTYTGTTTVNGGFLDVEGSIASSSLTTVNAGGALTGAGTVGNTTIATGGIFLPSNGFGTSTTVQGNLAFQSGALYLVQLNSTSSTFANVRGTAASTAMSASRSILRAASS